MGARKNPIAEKVVHSEFGAFCADRRCGTPVYIDRIERGKPVYRHVSRYAACQQVAA